MSPFSARSEATVNVFPAPVGMTIARTRHAVSRSARAQKSMQSRW